MIDLKQLITSAPFPDDVKKEALEKIDSFTEEQKNGFEQLCWQLLTQ
jgi:hypothetical protein